MAGDGVAKLGMSVPTGQQRCLLGPLLFTSDFDGGNMGRVERVEQPVSAATASSAKAASGGPGSPTSPGRTGTASTKTPSRGAGAASSMREEYVITVAPDCAATAHETNHRTWFFFAVSLVGSSGESQEAATAETDAASPIGVCSSSSAEEAMTINLAICNMSNQEKLFKEGYRPWLRKAPSESTWRRLPDSPEAKFSYQWCGEPTEGGTGLNLRWRQVIEPGSTLYVAFCIPFGYTDCQRLMDTLNGNLLSEPDMSAPPDRSGSPLQCLSDALQETWVPRPGSNIYFHRQTFRGISLEGRSIDLLTVSSSTDDVPPPPPPFAEANTTTLPGQVVEDGLDSGEPSTPSLQSSAADVDTAVGDEGLNTDEAHRRAEIDALLAAAGPEAREFPNRPLVFLSARVHPGETPGQFSFLGLLRFLLSDDPRAVWLRENFVFKLVPMLNPDGVARGHHRTNSQGLDLNRCYSHPVRTAHEGVWLSKHLLMSWASESRLLFCVDFHGHPTRRGCFLLGNRSTGMRQAWSLTYARLCQLNSPHFDIDACDFAEPVAAASPCSPGIEEAVEAGRTTTVPDPAISKQGTARAAIFRDCQLNHAYTFECNFHSGRCSKPMNVAPGLPHWATCPGGCTKTQAAVPYDPSCWAQAGEALGVSLLDLYGHNCCSRLPGSRYGSLAKLLSLSPSLGTRSSQQGLADAVPNVQGLRFRTVAEQQQSCDNELCSWGLTPKQLDILAKEFNSDTACSPCGGASVYPWVKEAQSTEAMQAPCLPSDTWQKGAAVVAQRAMQGAAAAEMPLMPQRTYAKGMSALMRVAKGSPWSGLERRAKRAHSTPRTVNTGALIVASGVRTPSQTGAAQWSNYW